MSYPSQVRWGSPSATMTSSILANDYNYYYWQGYYAYNSGNEFNPYEEGSIFYDKWEEGFRVAEAYYKSL